MEVLADEVPGFVSLSSEAVGLASGDPDLVMGPQVALAQACGLSSPVVSHGPI